MDYLDSIPPVAALLLNEDLGDLENLGEFSKRYRRIHKEVIRQAEWSLDHFEYFDERQRPAGKLVVTASAGLDPFSRHSICAAKACRLAAARQIARTLGLYAEVIAVPDWLSGMAAYSKQPQGEDFEGLRNQILVLRELEPLVQAGVMRFWSGASRLCSRCLGKFETAITEGVERLVEQWAPDLHVSIKDEIAFVQIRNSDDGIGAFIHPLNAEDKQNLESGTSLEDIGRKAFIEDLTYKLQRTLLDLRFSERIKSPLFSTARRQLLAIRSLDRETIEEDEISRWEAGRSLALPWIVDLTVSQVVQLRNEAAKALPAFREKLLGKILTPHTSAESVRERIEELRYDAVELEAELRALNPTSEAMFRNISGGLGIAASVYGFAAGAVPAAAALGGLISLLGYLHTAARKDAHDEEILISKPAYVLLKAKEITGHAPEGG